MAKRLDPKTPREFLEALHRLVDMFEEHWDEFPNGDGENGSPDDQNQTKTDVFIIIAGCADYGRQAIKGENSIKDMVNGTS